MNSPLPLCGRSLTWWDPLTWRRGRWRRTMLRCVRCRSKFSPTPSRAKNTFESFMIAIRKITNVTIIVTSTMTPTTVVTVDNTLKVASTAESEKPEMLVFCYLCYSNAKTWHTFKVDNEGRHQESLECELVHYKSEQESLEKHRIKMSIKYWK